MIVSSVFILRRSILSLLVASCLLKQALLLVSQPIELFLFDTSQVILVTLLLVEATKFAILIIFRRSVRLRGVEEDASLAVGHLKDVLRV